MTVSVKWTELGMFGISGLCATITIDRVQLTAVTEASPGSEGYKAFKKIIGDVFTAAKKSDARLPDRECFWLVERNTSPPQYVSHNSAGWHDDPWQARRFNTEREAHDYWRLMGEIDRPQFKVVEHMFINRND